MKGVPATGKDSTVNEDIVWTASSGVCPLGGCLPRGSHQKGVSAQRGCLPRGCIPACTEADPPPLWTEWLTDRCKNITFPQLRLRTVNMWRFELGLLLCALREGEGEFYSNKDLLPWRPDWGWTRDWFVTRRRWRSPCVLNGRVRLFHRAPLPPPPSASDPCRSVSSRAR